MLAQWVPLHAVSCSNLIETGGCAESREIPLRVTQNLWAALARQSFRSCFECAHSLARPMSRRTKIVFEMSRPVEDHAPSSSYLQNTRLDGISRSCSRLWILARFGTPAIRLRQIIDKRLAGFRKPPSRHLTIPIPSCRQDCPTPQRVSTMARSTFKVSPTRRTSFRIFGMRHWHSGVVEQL